MTAPLMRMIPAVPLALRPRATYHREGCQAITMARGARVTLVVPGMVIDTREQAHCVYCYGSAPEADLIARGLA